MKDEIEAPWIKYPGYPPGDTFWRQSGELWFSLLWLPYWQSLDAQQQTDYLNKYNVPDVWRDYYFDQEFQEWLRSTDSAP